MAETCGTYNQKLSKITARSTFAPESAPGPMRLSKPVTSHKAKSGVGQSVALASLSARQAQGLGLLTSGTCGPPSTTLSASADLNFCLASRLHKAAARLGSRLYTLTWQQLTIGSGLRYYQLAASERRTAGIELTGWPTPTAGDSNMDGLLPTIQKRRRTGKQVGVAGIARLAAWPTVTTRDWRSESASDKFNQKRWSATKGKPLSAVVTLASWVTPQVHDVVGRSKGQKAKHGPSHGRAELANQVQLSAWNTPAASDGNGGKRPKKGTSMQGRAPDGRRVNMGPASQTQIGLCPPQPVRLVGTGAILTGSSAQMVSSGRLNPALSRWMMGLPNVWDTCAP